MTHEQLGKKIGRKGEDLEGRGLRQWEIISRGLKRG